jgi:hypothetical protein
MFYALLNDDGTINRYPYTLTDLMRSNPGVSWPEKPSEELALSYGLVPVVASDPGPTDALCNRERTAQQQADGSWLEVWVDTPASASQVAERTEAQMTTVRADRNRRLSSSDWTQLPDAPANASDWAVYRQELRDITAQESFPWSITWPSLPG